MRQMKDSGIEWIGQIPNGWDTTKLLYLLKKPISDGPHETPEVFNEGIPFISVDSLNDTEDIDFSVVRKYISEEQYLEYQKKANLEKGDVLFSKAATIGKTAIVKDEKFMVWSPLAIIKTEKKKLLNKYLYYLLNCNSLINDIILHGSYNTQINVGMREIESTKVPVLPLSEQACIVEFLDKKCAEIDDIIAAKEKTNELLKERRQSIIYEAATKGLDPNVPMKDSGIEWIGQIPASWSVWRMKHLGAESMQYGANATGVDFDEQLPRYIRITDISESRELHSEGKQSLPIEIAKDYMLEDGDLLFARSGATAGKSFLYETKYGNCCFAGYLIKFKTDVEKAYSKFLYYYTLTQAYEKWTQQIFIQATIQNISAEKYNNLCFAIPDSLDTQKNIIEYLDEKCTAIDALISTNNSTIEKLKEYRQSIIYEAVTGKIEV